MSDEQAGLPEAKSTPEYSAPALDKGLDILELLAETEGGLGQLEIAQAIGRSPGQIFRMLATLERRGYVFRERQSGLYTLSMRMFELAHRHEPVRALSAAGLPVMRRLADELQQSCNLAVIDAEMVRVIAQVESPSDFGFRVRVGALFPLDTATGLVLGAFRATGSGAAGAAVASPGILDHSVFEKMLVETFLELPDSRQPSITDVVVPILRPDRTAVAALTVPYVATSISAKAPSTVIERARRAAEEIAESLALAGSPHPRLVP
ncbi:IclR family transcriptional regulator [Herbiconiux sp. CPCC 203407]|uniref:IclR family transcriptional regulator n=1 Tax=Herbiconiux oxytropis TaxID=2970915 RepID=A0AA41XH27_9MICO|nr:IclR family transcriptional regulator [Herbiconiux oxytropis]MCS5721970.1 IclR family transcriptional regulator [Herbiconiux oxytropis]MCS5725553.1 IclR family transcriptional regulator [Herbiconiux oxytropis]